VALQPGIEGLWDEFHAAVNMTSRELREWLATDAADERTERVPDQAGSETGQRVLEILSKRRTDVTDDDIEVMRQVVDLVASEHPDADGGDPSDNTWRRRLMSVGHDPLKTTR